MSMDTAKRRWPLVEAAEVAEEIRNQLAHYCEVDRLIVAGSIRRRKQEVGDVEIVYVSRVGVGTPPGEMFPQSECLLADMRIEQLVGAGVLEKRTGEKGGASWGEKNKLAGHRASGMPVDLFRTDEACFWNYLVCRTGPKESNMAIANAARDRGYKWRPYASGFESLNEPGRVVRMNSEREVFEFVGLSYKDPEWRSEA